MDFLCFSINKTSGCRAVTAASTRATIPGGEGEQIRIHNSGPNLVAVVVSTAGTTAVFPTDNSTPNGVGTVIPVGSVEAFTIGSADTLDMICPAAGTATVYYSRGKGA